MKAAPAHHDYPYRLRLGHPENAELRVERKGRFFVVDPAGGFEDDAVVVLTSPAPYRSRGLLAALDAGKRPTVIAAAGLVDWLARLGADAAAYPAEIDGVRVEGLAYTPPRAARPLARYLRASVAGARPVETLRRMAEAARAPNVEPSVLQLTFPDGARLVHLDLALHRDTDPAWVERAMERFGGPEWLIVGVPWGEGDAVVRLAPRFAARRVLVTELVNGDRREEGLPTELVTPVRDQLVAAGVEAHVFATQAGFRFE